MHIPDGFLDAKTALATGGLAILGLGVAVRRVEQRFGQRTVPLMATVGAFVFAAQMVNFPVAAGSSGHLLGGVLAAVLLGPWAAALVLALVLVVQCFVFQDGGLTALGANIVNMSFLGTFAGYGAYRLVSRAGRSKVFFGAGVAFGAYVSVVVGSAFCALELGASGVVPTLLALKAMALVHLLIGFGEALITLAVVGFVSAVRPELVTTREPASGRRWSRREWGWALAVCLVVAVALSPFASSAPDGLEWVAERLGFIERAEAVEPVVPSPLPDYEFPAASSAFWRTSLAGAAGTLLMLGLGYAVAYGLRRKTKDEV